MPEFTPQNNLSALSSRYGINAMVNYFNKELGNNINNLVIQDFYNNYLLDTIELAASNYIFQEYAKPYYVPEGYASKKLKRYGGLTEHTTPLPEGIPPKSDKTKVESFEATFNQYGRYMEFTDRVSYMTIDPIIAIYTEKYGKLAARTKERLARNELLNAPSILVPRSAGGNASLDHIMIGDKLTFNDYRVQVAKMKRMLVEPVEGANFHLIGAPETKFDLITDDMVRDFYGKDNGITAYQTDELPVLFNIKFRETMLDDFAYGYELANPGEIEVVSGNTSAKALRIYAQTESTDTSTNVTTIKQYYLNVPESVTSGNTITKYRVVDEARLSDGSYIPEKVTWNVSAFLTAASASIPSATYKLDIRTFTINNNTGVTTVSSAYDQTSLASGVTLPTNWKQVPLHRNILIGKDALIETGIEGHTDAKMYIKPLGSAGVLDPLEQRQSIGFKIDTLGYALMKPEAVVVCYTIPSGAVDTNDIIYTYTNGMIKNNTYSWDIGGKEYMSATGKSYTQLQVKEGYNQYGKVNPNTGNVDTDRFNVPGVQAPYYKPLDEFGAVPTRVEGTGMQQGTGNDAVPEATDNH